MTLIISKLNKYLAYILLCIVILFPSVLFSKLQITDEFLYQVAGFVKYQSESTFLFDSGYYGTNALQKFLPGYPILIAMLSKVTGVVADRLMFLPLGSVILAVCIFSIAKKIFDSAGVAFFCALYSSYELSLLNHYNIFAYSWNYPLYILFVSILIDLYSNKKWQSILLLFILFFGAFLIHYNVPIWMMIALFILSLMSYIKTKCSTHEYYNQYWYLLTSLLVIYVGYSKIFYNVWLPNFKTSIIGDSTNLFTNQISAQVLAQSSSIEKYRILSQWDSHISSLRLLMIIIIITPILIGIIISMKSVIFNNNFPIDSSLFQLIIAIGLVTATTDMAIYGSYIGINVKYLTFFLPIVSVIFLSGMKFNKFYKNAFIIILLFVVMTTFVLTIQHYEKNPFSTTEQFEPSKEWFYGSIDSSKTILADLGTFGIFIMVPPNYTLVYPKFFTSYDYEYIVNASSIHKPNVDYVIIDSKSKIYKPIHGFSNILYEPFGNYLQEINGNSAISKIYDDSLVYIYIPSPPD